jgi:hypothetical protein
VPCGELMVPCGVGMVPCGLMGISQHVVRIGGLLFVFVCACVPA